MYIQLQYLTELVTERYDRSWLVVAVTVAAVCDVLTQTVKRWYGGMTLPTLKSTMAQETLPHGL